MIKVLNLYSGLGGNRKHWTDVDITAVELNPEIARFYQDHFPSDKVIIADAHQFLIEHYKEFDFIWSSVECPTHSKARFWASKGGRYDVEYPDMRLYQEIIFLKHFFNGKFVVENVDPYYEPLIMPTINLERHLFWTNFNVIQRAFPKSHIFDGNIKLWQETFGFDITGYKFNRKDKVLRNCVHPDLGLHILNCALQRETVKEQSLFSGEIF